MGAKEDASVRRGTRDPNDSGIAILEKPATRKMAYVVIVVATIVFCLGLYFFQIGPQTEIISLTASQTHEITLNPMRNETFLLTPFEVQELAEYSSANLTDFLLGRAIDVKLQVLGNDTVTLRMNASYLVPTRATDNDSSLVTESVNNLDLKFSTDCYWQSFLLVIANDESHDVTVNLKTSQVFIVRTVRYDAAFIWLSAAFVSAAAIFAFQYLLHLTPDDLPDRALRVLLPKRYKQYITARRLPSLWFVSVLVGCVLVGTSILIVNRAEGNLILTAQIWEDYWYRLVVSLFLLLVTMMAILTAIRVIWGFVYYPLSARYYPDASAKKRGDALFVMLLSRSLLAPRSLAVYGILVVVIVMLFNSSVGLELCLAVWMPAFLVFLAYTSSQVYLESLRRSSSTPLHDFHFIKSSFGATFVISLLAVYSFQLATPLVRAVSQTFLDKAVLVTHNVQEWILSSTGLVSYFAYVTPIFAYVVPISAAFYYYFFVAFSTLRFPSQLVKKARKELVMDLAFFVIVFLCTLWLQSLYVQRDLQQVVVSLASSFIATSFRSYLEAWRSVPA